MKKYKILKSFQSNEYAVSIHTKYLNGKNTNSLYTDVQPYLEWGLAEGGELCCKGTFTFCNYPDWVPYVCCCFSISLEEMKKIVKEFGHLVIFT